NSLQPGQTCEIADAYVRMIDKVPARVIVHRLTKQQQQKRICYFTADPFLNRCTSVNSYKRLMCYIFYVL
ncbi:hypothetical protein COE43_27265, partial [Bacillus cereus]